MKSKQHLPMEPKEAMSYVVANEYDDPRRLVCTARALAAVICAAFKPEVTDMFLMAIHNEDYVLVNGLITQAYARLKEQIPTAIRALAGYQPFWELFLLFVSEELDDLEDEIGDLVLFGVEPRWRREALQELAEKEAQK